MKQTLLEMTQSILSDMNSEEVNSISDTVEAGQVASIIKDTYAAMVQHLDVVPEDFTTGLLTAVSDVNYPNYMVIPTNVLEVQQVKYDTSPDASYSFTDITYMKPADFLTFVLANRSTDTNVQVVTDYGGVTLLIRNDKMPQFYTSFDNVHLVFDSYDASIDSTLQAVKTLCYFKTEAVWSATDSFTPNLSAQLFPLLLAEAKSTCFVDLKQQANPKVEQVAKRQLTSTQSKKHREKKGRDDDRPNYGRN